MASNVSRGSAAKGKTKKWLEARGYQVAHLELVRWVYRGGRPAFAVKQDQFGSDLLAVGHNVILFVQVKYGKTARGGSFPEARREFGRFVFPDGVRCLVIAWPDDASIPRLVEALPDGSWVERKAM